jgi:hypothetical protein
MVGPDSRDLGVVARNWVKRAAAAISLGALVLVGAIAVAGPVEAATRPAYSAGLAPVASSPAPPPVESAVAIRHTGTVQRARVAPVPDLTEPTSTAASHLDSRGAAAPTGSSSVDSTDIRLGDARAPPAEGSV